MEKYLPLESKDVSPYSPSSFEVVGRVFKNKRWFIGELKKFDFPDSSTLVIKLEPMAELSANYLDSNNLEEFGDTIVTLKDIPLDKTFSQRSQPFSLIISPEKLIPNKILADVLIIRFIDGFALISKRPCDISAVKEILGRAETGH